MLKLSLILCLTVLLNFAWADADESATNVKLSNKEKWNQMSPEQKQAIREKYKKFMNLPESKKVMLVERFKQFKTFDPDKQQRIVQRFQKLNNMSPEKKQQLRERWNRWSQMSPEQKQQKMQKLQDFRNKNHNPKMPHNNGSSPQRNMVPARLNNNSSGKVNIIDRMNERLNQKVESNEHGKKLGHDKK